MLKPKPGQGGDDDGEGVFRSAAVGDRVDQRADQVEEVDEAARVGVHEEERGRVRLRRGDVQEVDGLPVDLGEVLREGVDPLLLGAPVEVVRPGRGDLAQVGVRHPVLPVVLVRDRAGEPGAREALAQVGEVVVGDGDSERGRS